MKWGELNHTHDGRKVKVWAESTPENPERGFGPFTGRILTHRNRDDVIPVLIPDPSEHLETGTLYYFADWYEVELI